MTTTVRTVPFGKLTAPDEINARDDGKAGLDELAASIEAHGLLQALAVRPAADGDGFEIIAGRRRYRAMQKLVKARKPGWAKSTQIPVTLLNVDDGAALEASLAENTVRLPMHAVDQHAVFARLVEQGRSETDIAARFGLDARQVKRQLALGRLAPEIRKAWRDEKISEDVAKAFTIEPRHELQVAAYERLKKTSGRHMAEWSVRNELAGGRIPKANVAAAVLERYVAAGGALVEDLFQDKSYLADAALLKRVEAEHAEAATAERRAALLAAGWAWVETAASLPPDWRTWDEIETDWNGLTEAEEKARDDLYADADEARAQGDEAKAARLDAEADAIYDAAEAASYAPQMRARSGCIIEVHDDGELTVYYGQLRPSADGQMDIEDSIAGAGSIGAAADDDLDDDSDFGGEDGGALPSVSSLVGAGEPPIPPAGPQSASDDDDTGISFALLQTLREAQTRAVAAIVTNDPELAMRLAVAALCTISYASPVKLTIEQAAHDRPATDGDFRRKLGAVAQLSYGEAVGKLASLIGRALSLVPVHKDDTATNDATAALVSMLKPDLYALWMREAFLPDDYFKRASKAVALAALEEMRQAPPIRAAGAQSAQEETPAGALAPADELAGKRKGDLATIAAIAARDTGWLPPELRHPAYTLEAYAALRLTGKTAAAEQTSEAA